MALCLFCDSSLNESTRPEHILLNALGGPQNDEVRNLLCA
jgi:hypothetical protein